MLTLAFCAAALRRRNPQILAEGAEYWLD